MSDLAAGKKAAAVKAVNDYVKVGASVINSWTVGVQVLFNIKLVDNLFRLIRNLELVAVAPLCLQWSDLASI